MSPQIIAALVLLAVFVLGTVRSVNLGAIALAAGIVVGPLLFGIPMDDVLAGFPVQLLVLILGVTYLFSIATVNGTIEWLVARCARAVGDRKGPIPLVLFGTTAVVTSLGALAPAAVAMLAPIGLRLAQRYEVPARLAALMIVYGAMAGTFSPLNPLGAIVEGTVNRAGLPTSPILLFLASMAASLVVALAVMLREGGVALFRRNERTSATAERVGAVIGAGGSADVALGADRDEPSSPSAGEQPDLQSSTPSGVGPAHLVTLVTLLGVAALALGFGFDVGTCALCAAILLNLLLPRSSAGATKLIGWNIILLICGIVTYVDLLQSSGAIDMLGHGLAGIGSPMFAVILLLVAGALTSAFASSAGSMGAFVPLLAVMLAGSDANTVLITTALAICVTLVDAAPFSSVGALVVSNSPERERPSVHSGLLRWAAAMVVLGPLMTGLALVWPAF
jgi:di/tricarboxylate transporter